MECYIDGKNLIGYARCWSYNIPIKRLSMAQIIEAINHLSCMDGLRLIWRRYRWV